MRFGCLRDWAPLFATRFLEARWDTDTLISPPIPFKVSTFAINPCLPRVQAVSLLCKRLAFLAEQSIAQSKAWTYHPPSSPT